MPLYPKGHKCLCASVPLCLCASVPLYLSPNSFNPFPWYLSVNHQVVLLPDNRRQFRMATILDTSNPWNLLKTSVP